MTFEEKWISSERIYEGAILNLRRDTVTAPKGFAYREIVEHNGAVGIVPITMMDMSSWSNSSAMRQAA